MNKPSTFPLRALAVVPLAILALPAAGQAPTQLLDPPAVPPSPAEGVPNLNGVWMTQYVSDLEEQAGEIPFTDHGLRRWQERDQSKDPTGYCLPGGPARIWHTPFPVQIVQTQGQVTFLFEYFHTFHRVFTDGRPHPEDPDKAWWGHSIGRYEGTKLIVDSIGLNDRTWLSTAGHEHSDQLHLAQVFEKTGPDTISYTVTYDDPVFFTEPWTMTTELTRSDYDILEYVCGNNKDTKYYVGEE